MCLKFVYNLSTNLSPNLSTIAETSARFNGFEYPAEAAASMKACRFVVSVILSGFLEIEVSVVKSEISPSFGDTLLSHKFRRLQEKNLGLGEKTLIWVK